MVGVINTRSTQTLRIRADASTASAALGSLSNNTSVKLDENQSKTDGNGSLWYKLADRAGYVFADYVVVDKTQAQPPISTNSSGTNGYVSGAIADVGYNDKFTSAADPSLKYDDSLTDPRLKRDYWKYVKAMGAPPQFNKTVDLQYSDDITPGCGRVFASTMLSNPTVLSLCPGKVKYLPGFSAKETDMLFNRVQAIAKGTGLEDKLRREDDIFEGKLYDFEPDPQGFADQLNMLCRTAAIFLEIGDEKIPGSSTPLSSFDYSFWTYPAEAPVASKGNIFEVFNRTISSAVDDSNYFHYFIAGGVSNVTEDISTQVEKSIIEEAMVGSDIDRLARNIQFLFGGVANGNEIMDGAKNEINNILRAEGDDSFFRKLGAGFKNYMSGGRMIFPQMVGDISYGKGLNASLKFISPYGNKLSIFLYCLVPIFSLFAMSYPRQISENMYTYPFIIRAYQPGWFNSDLAVITDLKIERGGQDVTAWTVDGIATEYDVNFTIQPLYSSLMSSSVKSPFLFINNGSLVEFIGNICGVDLKANNVERKLQMALQLLKSTWTDIPTRMSRGISNKLADKVANIFQFTN